MSSEMQAGEAKPLTLEWMEASRDHWMNKAIERKERAEAAEARVQALEAALARALALCDEWDEAYQERAEGTGVWTVADEELTQRLRAEWAAINGRWGTITITPTSAGAAGEE